MTLIKREQAVKILEKINMININKGIDLFNKTVQDFGESMDSISKEMSEDIQKTNRNSEARERKNKRNLDKIWGNRD